MPNQYAPTIATLEELRDLLLQQAYEGLSPIINRRVVSHTFSHYLGLAQVKVRKAVILDKAAHLLQNWVDEERS